MKQIYLNLALFFITVIAFAQQPIITSIVDGTCTGGAPKLIEIYADGTVDFTQFNLEKYSTGSNMFSAPYDLTPFGTRTNSFVYVYAGPETTLNAEFPNIIAADYQFSNTANNNGDDAVRIVNSATNAVIDIYGAALDGTGTTWEYTDSYAKRADGTGPDAAFIASNWITTAPNTLDNLCGTTTFETIVGAGSYSTTVNTNPTVTITAPINGNSLPSGLASVDLIWTSLNNPAGATFTTTVNGVATSNASSPFPIAVTNGTSYTATVEMLDGATVTASDVIQFNSSLPCNLQLVTITTTCQTTNSSIDLYDITVDFTGGSSSAYTIDTGGNGTIGGDDPSNVAAGQITITGVSEGTDLTLTITGDATSSSCNLINNITSPTCVTGLNCANAGDIIITEIMKNPNAVNDNLGEYFEVYNTTNAAIDMIGYVISDLGTNSFTVATSVIVPSNDYAIFSNNADSITNGGLTVDYEYNSFVLANSADEVIISCQNTVIDQVNYTAADFPNTSGTSMELSLSNYNAADNDLGANWGNATSIYGTGDLGTPGTANDFTLSTEQFTPTSFKMYPNPLKGANLTIEASNSHSIDVIIYSTLGQPVLSEKGITNSMNVSSLKSGLYMVKITQNRNSQTKKLVVP